MWTIIWTDDADQDHYERFEDKEELFAYVCENKLNGDDDAIVFPPEADELAMAASWVNWD